MPDRHSVTLPSATLTTHPAPRPLGAAGFPNLKIKFTPYASVPADLAPPKPAGKEVERSVRFVVSPGGRVNISWTVDTTCLGSLEAISPSTHSAIENAVGEWLLGNTTALGIERSRWGKADSGDNPTELVLTPSSSLSQLQSCILAKGEPVGKLERIQLCLSWAFAKSKGKREVGDMHGEERAMENDLDDDEETDQGGEEVELGAAEQALEQVGRGMQAVIRAQMIRRFPLVFDGAFADYQSSITVPPALLSATSRFLSLSAKYSTPLLGKARAAIDGITKEQVKSVRGRVEAMSRLPVRSSSQKRFKSAEGASDSNDNGDVERMTAYLERLEVDEEKETPSNKLHRALAQAVAGVGLARWLEGRAGRGKHSALKVKLSGVSAGEGGDEGGPGVLETAKEPLEVDTATPVHSHPSQAMASTVYSISATAFPSSNLVYDSDYDDCDDLDDDEYDWGVGNSHSSVDWHLPGLSNRHYQQETQSETDSLDGETINDVADWENEYCDLEDLEDVGGTSTTATQVEDDLDEDLGAEPSDDDLDLTLHNDLDLDDPFDVAGRFEESDDDDDIDDKYIPPP